MSRFASGACQPKLLSKPEITQKRKSSSEVKKVTFEEVIDCI